ncbi:MAG: citrate synthase family protein [Anaerolineales bacterium]|nr:citrate synthase family protein [Anaerolineales bacterium]
MAQKRYMTAQEAAQTLDVRVETIYAYVSRGLIRSEPAANGRARQRRYQAADVRALQRRQAERSDPSLAAQDALHFGTPVLDSAICLIADGQLYYRGRAATELAATASFEQVAGLIWQGDLHDQFAAYPGQVTLAPEMLASGAGSLSILQRFQAILPVAAAADPGAYDLRPAGVQRTAIRILRLLMRVAAGQSADLRQPLPQILATGWGHIRPEAAELIRAALILCADHELNASSFTARVVASTRANPYNVVQAGLAALSGSLHGANTERVWAQLQEIGEPAQAEAVLTARLRRGDQLEGFGHKLYPQGDPRARYLLNAIREAYPDSPYVALGAAMCTAAAGLIEEEPTVDVALVVLAGALGLPAGSPLAIFALGRTVGWIGHALEAYASQPLIRPRARYTGILPEEGRS